MKKLFIIVMFIAYAGTASASYNVFNGNFSHYQGLFSTDGGPMPSRIDLTYNSQETVAGVFGKGWSYNYDLNLLTMSGGTIVLNGGGEKRFYTSDGSGGYTSQFGDNSILTIDDQGDTDSSNDTYVITFTDGRKFVFAGTSKKIISIVDRYNNSISLTYTSNQIEISEIVDNVPLRSTTLNLDANGKVSSIIDPANQQYDFHYDVNGLLYQIEYPAVPDPDNPEGSTVRPVWTFLYNGGLIEFITDPMGNQSQYTFANGKIVTMIDPANQARTIQYNTPYDFVTTVTENDDGKWLYYVSAETGQLSIKDGPEGFRDTYSYYKSGDLYPGQLYAHGNNAGTTYYWAYDSNGNPTDININGRHTLVEYDAYSRVTRIENLTDSAVVTYPGTVTTYTYALNGETGSEELTIVAPMIDAGDTEAPTITIQYNQQGQIDFITDALGRRVDLQYNSTHLLERILDVETKVESVFTDYNPFGRPQTITLKAPNQEDKVTRLVYDAAGNLITNEIVGSAQTTEGDPIVSYLTKYVHDLNGNLAYVQDAESKTVAFESNHTGQVERITQILNGQQLITDLIYSGAGCVSCGSGVDKLVQVVNARQNNSEQSPPLAFEFRYDHAGRKTAEMDENGNATLFNYPDASKDVEVYRDVNSDLIVDAGDEKLMTYDYHRYGPLTKIIDHANGDEETRFYYTGLTSHAPIRLTWAYNNSSNYKLDYYDNGWLKNIEDNNLDEILLDYSYNLGGQRELFTLFPNDATQKKVIDYVYDPANGRLIKISTPAGDFNIDYDDWGRRKSLGYPNGLDAVYSYHSDMDLLTGIDLQNSAQNSVLAIGYPDHDLVGNRKERTEDGTSTAFTYDDLYRLTQAQTGLSEENFKYDEVGNRTEGPTVKEVLGTYDHNAANQMLAGRIFSYDYDGRGNQHHRYLNSEKTKYWEYRWDGQNRMIQADLVIPTSILRTITFRYDPFGRRIQKQVTNNPGPSQTATTFSYIYDNEDIVQITEADGTSTHTTFIVHGPGIDEPLAMIRDGVPYFFHADGLGSVVAVTDMFRNIVQRYSYDAFGMVTASDPDFPNAYAFTGREWDKELGLYYYRARFYDPMEGRFISKDPIGFAGGDFNLYGYVSNNPENWIDPYGLISNDMKSLIRAILESALPKGASSVMTVANAVSTPDLPKTVYSLLINNHNLMIADLVLYEQRYECADDHIPRNLVNTNFLEAVRQYKTKAPKYVEEYRKRKIYPYNQ
jgi:RHS repeat-associated protein